MIFKLFERKKIEVWELEFLQNLIYLLGENYTKYLSHLELKYIKGIRLNFSDIPNYVKIRYTHDFFEKYEDRKAKPFKIHNIKVFDEISKNYLEITVFFGAGFISGYSIDGNSIKKYIFNNSKIDISSIKLLVWGEESVLRIIETIPENIKNILEISSPYIVNIDGKEFINIHNLDDGDFIGYIPEGSFYHIRHDPFGAKLITIEELKFIIENKG